MHDRRQRQMCIRDRQEMLVGILKEVTSGCNHCKIEVAKRLSQITGVVQPIEIIEESDVV
jgi:hypothetical protein